MAGWEGPLHLYPVMNLFLLGCQPAACTAPLRSSAGKLAPQSDARLCCAGTAWPHGGVSGHVHHWMATCARTHVAS